MLSITLALLGASLAKADVRHRPVDWSDFVGRYVRVSLEAKGAEGQAEYERCGKEIEITPPDQYDPCPGSTPMGIVYRGGFLSERICLSELHQKRKVKESIGPYTAHTTDYSAFDGATMSTTRSDVVYWRSLLPSVVEKRRVEFGFLDRDTLEVRTSSHTSERGRPEYEARCVYKVAK